MTSAAPSRHAAHGERSSAAVFAVRATSTAPVHHLLDGLAGVFDTEARAREVLHELGATHGLLPSQLVLLCPSDAGRVRFARLARQWSCLPRWSDSVRPEAIVLGAALGSVLTALVTAMLLLDEEIFAPATPLDSASASFLALLIATCLGALTGAGLAMVRLRKHRLYRGFNLRLRTTLAAGHWIVLAHGVPWAVQAGVVSLVSLHCVEWRAVSTGKRWH